MKKKSQFQDLIERYLAGNVSADEQKKLETWLELNKTGNHETELTPEAEDELFRKILASDEIRYPLKKKFTGYWRMAASIALIATVSMAVYFITRTWADTNVNKMMLNDGTLVWLKNGSALTYSEPAGDSARRAELTGEALFEVAKDPSRPFIIQTGDVFIKVLGTSFNLKTEDGRIELKVLTGKVNVSSYTRNLDVNLLANQEFSYAPNRGVSIGRLEQPDVLSVTAQTEYNMNFANQPLQDVLNRLEAKFDIEIELQQADAKKCRITANLTDQGLASSLEILTEILHIQYRQAGNKVLVTGTGCQ